ncbi:MAG: hypothetical protein HGB10_11770 [Coriobacteriia bacterium]|nr:hypothetical protein [Coriobacteriia bacterium]
MTVGTGEFPKSLDRINWGAYFLSFIWALAHNDVRWAAILAVANVTQFGLSFAVGLNNDLGAVGRIVASVTILLALMAVQYAFAIGANKGQWTQAEHMPPHTRQPVGAWTANQKVWVLVGLGFYVVSNGLALVAAVRTSSWAALWPLGSQAAVLLAILLADRRKQAEFAAQS